MPQMRLIVVSENTAINGTDVGTGKQQQTGDCLFCFCYRLDTLGPDSIFGLFGSFFWFLGCLSAFLSNFRPSRLFLQYRFSYFFNHLYWKKQGDVQTKCHKLSHLGVDLVCCCHHCYCHPTSCSRPRPIPNWRQCCSIMTTRNAPSKPHPKKGESPGLFTCKKKKMEKK